MDKKRFLFLLNILILLVLFSSSCFSLDEYLFSDLSKLASNPITTSEASGGSSGIVDMVSSGSSGSAIGGTPWSTIIGSTKLILESGRIVGGNIVSTYDNNNVVAYNLITGEQIIYNMDAGDKVVVSYPDDETYKAKMDEGVEAETSKITFIAHDDDSALVIREKPKKTKEASGDAREYEFYNGIIIYENDNIIENINTTDSDSVSVDKDHMTGFECYSLSKGAKYSYEDKSDRRKDFNVINTNRNDYHVCMKKTAYDEYELENIQNSALLDVMNNNFLLKSTAVFEKDDDVIYESYDAGNKANIEARVDGTVVVLENKAPVKSKIAEIFSGIFKIIERKDYGIPLRDFDYGDRRKVTVTKYSSDIGNNYYYGDVIIKYNTLYYYSKDGENKLVMHDPLSETNEACYKLLKEVLSYTHTNQIENEYIERC